MTATTTTTIMLLIMRLIVVVLVVNGCYRFMKNLSKYSRDNLWTKSLSNMYVSYIPPCMQTTQNIVSKGADLFSSFQPSFTIKKTIFLFLS